MLKIELQRLNTVNESFLYLKTKTKLFNLLCCSLRPQFDTFKNLKSSKRTFIDKWTEKGTKIIYRAGPETLICNKAK